MRVDEVEDAISEWDESTPTVSRTTTRSDPVTTRRLAKASQRIAIPERVPETLEEALLALAEKLAG